MLPEFRYHPDPVATGSVKPSTVVCACCNKARGYVYEASVRGSSELNGRLCPWCIADGKAASRFDVLFSLEAPLVAGGVPRQTVIEVTRRTPGYSSWQDEQWQVCCGDACAFYGDASAEELRALEREALERLQKTWPITPERWNELLTVYVPGGGVSVFKFVCRVCGQPTYALDLA